MSEGSKALVSTPLYADAPKRIGSLPLSTMDVLSFALTESDEPEVEGGPETEILGDLVLSVERVAAQAEEYGHSLRREAAFLTVHGMLHLLGYDHIEDEDREEMEREQRVVMDALGISRGEKENG